MPKIEGWIFDTPKGPICPCVLDAAVRDSRRASRRGRAARGGWCDCAGHASSRRAPGCASCQRGLRRSRDSSCLHCAHPVRARQGKPLAPLRRKRGRGGPGERPLSVRQSDGQPGRGGQTTSPVAIRSIACAPRWAVPSSTRDGWRHRTAARHASRPSAATRRAVAWSDPERSVGLKCDNELPPTKWSVELQVPKIRSARGRPLAGISREKTSPHFSGIRRRAAHDDWRRAATIVFSVFGISTKTFPGEAGQSALCSLNRPRASANRIPTSYLILTRNDSIAARKMWTIYGCTML